MLEILKHSSIEVAKQKNELFKYFIEKCDCQIEDMLQKTITESNYTKYIRVFSFKE